MAHTYDHPRPAVTVDCALFSVHDRQLRVLLIQRHKAPFAGRWALPGGFVDKGEDLEPAAHRELEEETGIRGVKLQQLAAFGTPGRDPRGHTVSIVHLGFVPASLEPKGGDDARDARWFPVSRPPKLAFDHAKVLKAAVARLRRLAASEPIGLDALPRTFDFEQLHELYEAALGFEIEPRSLRRTLADTGVIVAAGTRFRFDRRRYQQLAKEGVLLEVVG